MRNEGSELCKYTSINMEGFGEANGNMLIIMSGIAEILTPLPPLSPLGIGAITVRLVKRRTGTGIKRSKGNEGEF